MGVLDHVSEYFDRSNGSSQRRKSLQTVNVRVLIDCEGCERKVRRALEGMKGVRDVTIEPNAQKVTVVGYVEPNRVVARIIHRTGKRAELYPYVPYDVVAHPYASGVYDNRAPAGYVRNTEYDNRAPVGNVRNTEYDNRVPVGNVRNTEYDNSAPVGYVRNTEYDNRVLVGNLRNTEYDNSAPVGYVRNTEYDNRVPVGNVRNTEYDNRAPVGYVRNTEYDPHVSRLARASSTEVRYTTAFSDENSSACVVM